MALPTSAILSFFVITFKSLAVTKNRCTSIKTFPPKIATLFGVTPHSVMRNIIADSAIPFTITVTKESKNIQSTCIVDAGDLLGCHGFFG